uniref:Uncharacterized protein n=1 Tax=viral metagenome TaxID=1070528 RepID=A0A6M3LB42_9ZZZZ
MAKKKPESFGNKLADGVCSLCINEMKDVRQSTICTKCILTTKSQFVAKKGKK